MAGQGEKASLAFQNTAGKTPQINRVSVGTAPPGVSASTCCPLNGFWVGGRRGWWYRTHPCSSLCGPCPLLDAGFWKSKFDPSLTRRDTFHLDQHFTVPVDMMHARTYPLRWFLLEQPEIQVTLGCRAGPWCREVGKREAVDRHRGGVCPTLLAVMSLGQGTLEVSPCPYSGELRLQAF